MLSGGYVNMTYPWGNEFSYKKLNIWEEDRDELKKLEEERIKAEGASHNSFPKRNLMTDGYRG